MYRHRNRPRYTDEELKRIYQTPHEHHHWSDHIQRVQETIKFAKELFPALGLVADLSCGDGTIARNLSPKPILGDFAGGYEFVGPMEVNIGYMPQVDLFIITETLEHLDDPLGVLKVLRERVNKLLVSTPVHAFGDIDHNLEHYWTYDREGVEDWLTQAGFTVLQYREIHNGIGYHYGIWGCS